ncbi:MAG: UUP1 family membrane protein [Verrucomicrobiota bacterium JB023]|nr:UUP1 family membrane protein [Verrucomicrobiota bacterium JB023]
MKRKSALLWVVVLALFGTALYLSIYKRYQLGIPFFPGDKVESWVVEAQVRFQAEGRPVRVELALPDFEVPDLPRQQVASEGYGYTEVVERGQSRIGRWSARNRSGLQNLYYQIHVREELLLSTREQRGEASAMQAMPIGGANSVIAAANRLLDECRDLSSDAETFVAQLTARLWGEITSQDAAILKRSYQKRYGDGWGQILLTELLAAEAIPTRRAWGVILNDELGPQRPIEMVEYYDGYFWRSSESSPAREPGKLAVWARGDALLDVRGGRSSEVFFFVEKNVAPLEATLSLQDAPFWVGTIASLPVKERNVFRYISLIPVGAFVIVVLRNLVGLSMLGTFMPVLLSLSFLEIPLRPALVMFALILAAGLSFRFFLTKLNLLVVPRVAACVVVVTLLMIALGLISFKLGMMDGLRVTVFPMIVLAWTIERMSLLWDEEGASAALWQVAGSLAAALAAYLIMIIREVNYWAQYFPELLLLLLAGILLIGRYTGYRASELIRFRSFVGK